MSARKISIDDLNKRIDELIKEYEEEQKECSKDKPEKVDFYKGKIEALFELRLELNDPEPAVNIEETVQQTLNVIEAKNITGNEL